MTTTRRLFLCGFFPLLLLAIPSCSHKTSSSLQMDSIIQQLGKAGLHPVEVSAAGDNAMALLAAMRGGKANKSAGLSLSASKMLLLNGKKAKLRAYETKEAAITALEGMMAFQERRKEEAEVEGQEFFPSHFFRKGPYVLEVKGSRLGPDLKPKAVDLSPQFLEKVERAFSK